MNIRKGMYRFLFLCVTGLMTLSCESWVEGINDNPNAFQNATSQLLLNSAHLSLSGALTGSLAQYHGMFIRHFTGSDRQYVSFHDHNVGANFYDDGWDNLYRAVKQLRLIKVDVGTSNKSLTALADVFQALAFGTAASQWGDVPFAEAGETTDNPKYENQKKVYEAIVKSIESAIPNLKNATGKDLMGSSYGNSVLKNASGLSWVKVAHTLVARYYLHLGDYTKAIDHAKLGIDKEGTGWTIKRGGTVLGDYNNYYAFIVVERVGYLTSEDAVLPKILDPSASATYRGNDKTDETQRFKYYFTGNKGTYAPNTEVGAIFAAAASDVVLTYVENALILAEASYQKGDRAKALVELNKVRDRNNTFYKAYGKVDKTLYRAYEDADLAGEELLKEILWERYISFFGQLETYNDVRRTNNYLAIPSKVKGKNIPQRAIYPQSEINANANVIKGKDRYDQVEIFPAKPYNKQ